MAVTTVDGIDFEALVDLACSASERVTLKNNRDDSTRILEVNKLDNSSYEILALVPQFIGVHGTGGGADPYAKPLPDVTSTIHEAPSLENEYPEFSDQHWSFTVTEPTTYNQQLALLTQRGFESERTCLWEGGFTPAVIIATETHVELVENSVYQRETAIAARRLAKRTDTLLSDMPYSGSAIATVGKLWESLAMSSLTTPSGATARFRIRRDYGALVDSLARVLDGTLRTEIEGADSAKSVTKNEGCTRVTLFQMTGASFTQYRSREEAAKQYARLVDSAIKHKGLSSHRNWSGLLEWGGIEALASALRGVMPILPVTRKPRYTQLRLVERWFTSDKDYYDLQALRVKHPMELLRNGAYIMDMSALAINEATS